MIENIKEQLMKKPEDLTPDKLQQAKSLAGLITLLRQASYAISYMVGIVGGTLFFCFNVLDRTTLLGNIGAYFFGISAIIFCLFKIRDFLRRTI